MDFLSQSWCGLSWTPWIPFTTPVFKALPPVPGVYRVKPVNKQELAYIGQTGRNLRERLTRLRDHSLALLMPFNDPHTAAPNLWAWRDAQRIEFECSIAPTSFSKKERLAFEHCLLWQYRLEKQESTWCNHGRFHPNYHKSRDRSTGERGGRLPEGIINPNGGESLSPLHIQGSPRDTDWMELTWSQAYYLSDASMKTIPAAPGVYKLFCSNSDLKEQSLLYIGQTTDLSARLGEHSRKNWGCQTPCFSFSAMAPDIRTYQLCELENDLIAGYCEQMQAAPLCQFNSRILHSSVGV